MMVIMVKTVEKSIEGNFLMKEFMDLENEVKHGKGIKKNVQGWFE